MSERQLTLIDVDENPFVVRLKEDRIQLAVIDCRPELEASELRALASVLFAVYCGAPLVGRLDAARARLVDLRDRLASAGGSDQVLGALDGAVCTLANVRHDIVAPCAAMDSPSEPANPAAGPSSTPSPSPSPRGRAPRRTRAAGASGPRRAGAATSSRLP
jgi:hypothetical protein